MTIPKVRMRVRLVWLGAAMMLLVMFAPGLRADSITQNFYLNFINGFGGFNGTEVAAFDPAAGTLISAEIELSGEGDWQPVGGSFTGDSLNAGASVGYLSASQDFSEPAFSTGSYTVTFDMDATSTDAFVLASLTGNGTLTPSLALTPNVSGFFGADVLTGTLVFNYSAAGATVPEPPSLLLLATGLLLAGLAMAWRRCAVEGA